MVGDTGIWLMYLKVIYVFSRRSEVGDGVRWDDFNLIFFFFS